MGLFDFLRKNNNKKTSEKPEGIVAKLTESVSTAVCDKEVSSNLKSSPSNSSPNNPNIVSAKPSDSPKPTIHKPSSSISIPDLPKAADKHGLFRLLSYAIKVNSAYHKGKMKDGFITIKKIDGDCKLSYSLVHNADDSETSITFSVNDFLRQDTRIKICEYLFPERTQSNPELSSESYIFPDKYDDKQREAICLDSGYHLVLAPAGCGKTDILAERVRRAIYNGVNVDDMLCLTFTNRASRGMRARVKQIIGDKANDLFIGNTHRFCSKFVFDNNIVNQSSAIMDEDDMLSVINGISDYVIEDKEDKIDAASLDYEERKRLNAVIQVQHLMMQYRLGHPKSVILSQESDFADNDKTIRFYSPQQFASLCKEAGLPVSIDSLLSIYDNAETHYLSNNFSFNAKELLRLLYIAKKYEMYKEEECVIDFDDLLLLTYEFARNNPNVIHKYKWIQIDEVQDLNPLQFAIVDAFTDKKNVTVYLGDEQQAIFSFIGAKLDTLGWLKDRCLGNLHHLNKCYRSPKYLLDVFNDYANIELDTDPDFLPKPNNFDIPGYKDLLLYEAETSETAHSCAVNLTHAYPDGRTAILVTANADADLISKCLGNTPHFKISGTDLFSLKQTKLLLAHLNVVNFEINFLAWARIIASLKLKPTYADARQFVSSLKPIGLNPSDFLLYNNSSYLLEFLKYYRSQPIVIFDTETTGLDVFENDIVQIAATKYINGKAVDYLNILLHTDQSIPPMLGKIVNPLVEEYANRPHLGRTNGLQQFVDFSKGCVLIGHNVQYDYNILINNCKRDLPGIDIRSEYPVVFDTLKLARLVCPSFRSYKLKDLLVALELEGENSHLADEDIIATFSVAEYCYNKAQTLKESIKEALTSNSDFATLFRQSYGELFREAKEYQYLRKYEVDPALALELRKAYKYFIDKGYIKPFSKFNYICAFLEAEVIDNSTEPSLYEQLSNHIMDLNTFKEADVCDSSIVTEKIFVATVHKAKGLEFENVIVYGCVDDVYPFFSSKDDPYARKEDARKLYVAISRAKKRLCLLTFDKKIVYSKKWGKTFTFNAYLSPFLHRTLAKHKFTTIQEMNE